jgi:hypothetical protein
MAQQVRSKYLRRDCSRYPGDSARDNGGRKPVLRRLSARVDKYDYKLDLDNMTLTLKLHSDYEAKLKAMYLVGVLRGMNWVTPGNVRRAQEPSSPHPCQQLLVIAVTARARIIEWAGGGGRSG